MSQTIQSFALTGTQSATSASADFSIFVVTILAWAADISQEKPYIFPRLPAWSTPQGYGHLWNYVAFSQLVRLTRLHIGFLSTRIRVRYCSLYVAALKQARLFLVWSATTPIVGFHHKCMTCPLNQARRVFILIHPPSSTKMQSIIFLNPIYSFSCILFIKSLAENFL